MRLIKLDRNYLYLVFKSVQVIIITMPLEDVFSQIQISFSTCRQYSVNLNDLGNTEFWPD